MTNILFITKRQYTQKDLLDDQYGRLWEIPKGLSKIGFNVQGVCLSYKARRTCIIKKKPVQWESINLGKFKIFGLVKYIFKIKCKIKETDIVIASSDSIYGILGYFISRSYKKKIIFDLYDNYEANLLTKLPVIKQLYKYVIKRCDAVLCVSIPLENYLKINFKSNNTFVIENAAPEKKFFPMDKKKCRQHFNLPDNAIIIGTAGALTKSRGIEILFNAFESLKKKYKDIYLAIAGPRDIDIPIENRIIDLGILSYDDVPLFINTLDVAVICNIKSKFGEYCFPQKAIEIMACNIPLISANIGSMKISFSDSPECLYKWNSAESLAQTIEHRLNNRETNYKDVHTWSTISKKIKQIINKIS